MKIFQTLFLLSLFVISLEVTAQDTPKNIYELYGLQKKGCEIDLNGKKSMEFVDEAVIDMAPPPPSSPVPNVSSQLGELITLFAGLREELAEVEPQEENIQVLKNGSVRFNQNGKWGIKTPEGKVIMKPLFDKVYTDKYGGFRGYQNGKCKYYDGATGELVVNQSFYAIEALTDKIFLVQSKDGFGLFSDGKLVLEAEYENISMAEEGENIYFDVERRFFLLGDFKTVLPYSYSALTFVEGDIVISNNNIYDIKRNRRLICEEGYTIKVLNEKLKLFAIQKRGENYFFLIDAKGNLLSDEAYSDLASFTDDGIGIASVQNTTPGGRQNQQLTGLINTKGKWLITPQYRRIDIWKGNMRAWPYNQNQPIHIDKKGNEIKAYEIYEKCPESFDEVESISDDYALGFYKKDGKIESKIFEIATGKIIKSGLDFNDLKPIKKDIFCNQGAYIAYSNEGVQVVDKNFEPLLPIKRRYFYGGEKHMEGSDRNDDNQSVRTLYDCDGNPVKVKLNGREYDTFETIKLINDELTYIYFNDGMGFIVNKEGEGQPMDYNLQFIRSAGLAGMYSVTPYGNRGTGLINQKGETLIPIQLKSFSGYNKETGFFAFVTYDKKAGLLNAKGEIHNNQLYDDISYLGSGFYKVKKDSKYGLLDNTGTILLPITYNNIFLKKGLILAKDDNGAKQYDIMGNLVE